MTGPAPWGATEDVRPASGAVRWSELEDALDTERRLLGELQRVLLRQREGLSANDTEVLDDSVYSAQRVLLTLQQARLRRRTLVRILSGVDDLKPSELEDALDGVPATVLASRDRLVEAAQALQRDLRVNRRAIQGAVAVGDRLIRALAGASEKAPLYTAPQAPDGRSGGSPGALLDRQV